MWVASFELHATYADAFTMLGFPYGAANDAAALVGWSDRHGFEGVKRLADGIERLEQTQFSSPLILADTAYEIGLDARGASVLEVGVPAFDFTHSGGDRIRVVTLRNVEDIALSAGLGQVAIERGLDLTVSWRYDKYLYRAIADAVTATLDVMVSSGEGGLENNVIVMTPVCDAQRLGDTSTGENVSVFSSTMLAERALASLIDGIKVDDTAWKQVLRIAKQILIPESRASRSAGVGADED